MIRQCDNCLVWFEDVFRYTSCPHDTFPANDGNNNFKHYGNSYLSKQKPSENHIFGAHKNGD